MSQQDTQGDMRYVFTRNGHGAAHPHNTRAECVDCARRLIGEDVVLKHFSHSSVYKVQEYQLGSGGKGPRPTGNDTILTVADAIVPEPGEEPKGRRGFTQPNKRRKNKERKDKET